MTFPRETSRASTLDSLVAGKGFGTDHVFRGHIVQIVTFPDASRWVIDICFGSDGPTQLMLLREESYIYNMGTQDAQFIRDFIPGQVSRAPEHRMWQYQCRNSDTQSWGTFYSFSDVFEWLTPDFGMVNCFTAASLDSSDVTSMCVVEFLRRAVTDGKDGQATKGRQQEVFGKLMLVNELVEKNPGGKKRVVQECRSEEETVQTLREWFRVELIKEESVVTKGHMSETK